MTINLIVFLGILGSFVAGYLVGRVDKIAGALQSNTQQPASFLKAAKTSAAIKAAVNIDDTKYVTTIRTDGLAKMQDTAIGKTTTTQDDIQTSVSKLAQLKGK